MITVVDLHDPARPAVVQRIVGRADPLSVSFSPDGALVAIAYDTAQAAGTPLDLSVSRPLTTVAHLSCPGSAKATH